MNWEKLSGSIYRFRDSCNVYCIVKEGHALVINAGSGAWIDRTDELPVSPEAVLCTHHFRDHVAGAASAAEHGMHVYAPYWEREFFEDAEGLFQRRETYIIYDNIWDLFGPTESIPISGWLRDWEELSIAGIELTVLPTGGVSPGAISLLAECEGGRILFCGELIHSPGRIARIAPLQYNYNDLTGAVNLLHSIGIVKAAKPQLLAPSLGPELIPEPEEALDRLAENLKAALAPRPEERHLLELLEPAPLRAIGPSVYQANHTEASTYFIVSKTKEVLAIDFGYEVLRTGSRYPYPRNRMSTLHSLDELERLTGSRRVDTVLVTHFHDDHVNGIPLLQRLFGTRCYAGENFAALLADPSRFAFPCTWPEPIEVEALPLEKEFHWKEFVFRLYPMSGHTRFSTLIAFEADGRRYVATGDQYFSVDSEHPGHGPSAHNHVYRNGASLGSFEESNRVMEALRPDVILPGHGTAYEPTEEFYERIAGYAEQYREIHTRLMPIGQEEVHFDVDSRSAWLAPYRARLHEPAPIRYVAHLRNPYAHVATLRTRLATPEGWKGGEAAVEVGARGETEVELTLVPPPDTRCRRQAIALELWTDEGLFGQVAEALVTIGHPHF